MYDILEDADECTISRRQAVKLVLSHGNRDTMEFDVDNEILTHYNGGDVLRWLGY